MQRNQLHKLEIIEYLKRTKEDTTIEEHRIALDIAIKVIKNSNYDVLKCETCRKELIFKDGNYFCEECSNTKNWW